MKSFFKMFTNKWVITAIGFICLAIVIWFVGPLIAVAGKVPLASVMARLLLILLFVLLWVVNLLRIQAKVNKANAQLAEDIGGDTEDDDSQRSREEVEKLQGRFEEALQVLKSTNRGKTAANIYELPWYMIIGPPGSGKTTALVNSGLHFPLAEKYGNEALRGVGGTRNCDWWFTDEAILLDTAGRFVTQDSNKQSGQSGLGRFSQVAHALP